MLPYVTLIDLHDCVLTTSVYSITSQVCAAINLFMIPFTEGLEPFRELAKLGPAILISNAAVAFCLNVAAVFLIGVGSGLVLTLAGVLKVRSTHALDSGKLY